MYQKILLESPSGYLQTFQLTCKPFEVLRNPYPTTEDL
jgi:hypothetical protein